MSGRVVAVLAAQELRDAWRNRWFVLFAITFTALALGLAWLSVSGVARSGVASLARTAASLINLVLLVVPLIGLSLGAAAIVLDRERGRLLYLLAQPVDVLEVTAGKLLGLAAAVTSALLAGFGFATFAIARAGGGAGGMGPFLAFLGLAVMLAVASIALGLLISALCSRAAMASGIVVFLWLLLVFIGDLGLMGTALVLELRPRQLLILALGNPLQVFKMASVLVLRGGLEALGPAGLYAQQQLGAALGPMLVGVLLLWTSLAAAVTAVVMRRRGGMA